MTGITLIGKDWQYFSRKIYFFTFSKEYGKKNYGEDKNFEVHHKIRKNINLITNSKFRPLLIKDWLD
jgi:hypothetical protein